MELTSTVQGPLVRLKLPNAARGHALDDAAIDALRADGIIGDRPSGL